MKLDRLFYCIGYNISKYPVLTIVISLLCVGVLLSGLMFLEFEIDPQKLWVAQDSDTNQQQQFYNEKFGAFFRINQLIMRETNETKESDLFQKRYLEKIYYLQDKIEKGKFDYLGNTYYLRDFCYRPVSTQGCMVTSPMDFWKFNLTRMQNDEDVKETGRCLQTEISSELPCFDRIGTPVQINAIFGKQSCMPGESSGECDLCRKQVKSLAVTFLLNHNIYTDEIAMVWERDIFQKAIFEFNEEEKKAGSNLNIDFISERSVPDELDKENSQNIGIVFISYLLMFVYISFSMGEFPSLMLSRVLVALGGICVVVLSFASSIALVSYMGIRMSLISAEVVPFLVLAIGVDNMFIITGAKDRKKAKPNVNRQVLDVDTELLEQMAATLKEVGPSITTAAFSEFLAFLVGYLTKIPALQSFCLCAACAVLVDYFLQITLFVSVVTLDEIRVRNGRYDIFPCFKSRKNVYKPYIQKSEPKLIDERSDIKLGNYGAEEEVPNEANRRPRGKIRFQHFLSHKYVDFLNKLPVKITILVVYLGLISISIVGIMKFPLGLDQRTTVIQHETLYKYFDTQPDYVDVGPPAYLVFHNVDYNNDTNLAILDDLLDHISFLSSVSPPVYSWYKEFQKFMSTTADWKDRCNKNVLELKKLPIEFQVREFLKMRVDDNCCLHDSVCGEPYKDDIAFGPDGRIEASRFRFAHVALRNQSIYVDSLIQTRQITRAYTNNFTTYEDKPKNEYVLATNQTIKIDTVYSYALFYVYYDQYTFIRGVSVANILIALASIFLAIQIIMNIKAALIVVLFTFSCVFNLIGVLWIWNFYPGYFLELNAVSVVNIVLACGLSVEFTVHLIIFYFRCRKDDPVEKVRYAMKNVGVGVLIGIITTKIIGVVVLAFAPSKIFEIYYFRMYFSLIVIGFFHGFMVLPVFLSMFNLKRRPRRNHVEKRELDLEQLLPNN